jgi:hypothetical protein
VHVATGPRVLDGSVEPSFLTEQVYYLHRRSSKMKSITKFALMGVLCLVLAGYGAVEAGRMGSARRLSGIALGAPTFL